MQLRKRTRDRRDDVMYAKWQCQTSLGKRVPYYRRCRDLYMYGGDPAVPTRVNKIKSTIKKQSSFLYSPQQIRFWLDVPPEEEEPATYDRLDPTADALALAWHDSGLGKIFKRCVTWGLVYGASIICALPRLRTDGKVEVIADYVHPQQFGVWDDTQPELEKQESFQMTSYFSLPQVHRMLAFHPRRAEIERSLYTGSKQQSGFEGMIITPPNASIFDIKPEFWSWYSRKFDYAPVFSQPYYEVTDQYIFDDDTESYQLVTTTGDTIIWDRPMEQCCIPGVPPFVKVCAEEHPEWFWGISLADELCNLQLWIAEKMDRVDRLIDRHIDPPAAATGVGQAFSEKMDQFRGRKGAMTLPAGATIQTFQPQISSELFEWIMSIDQQIDEMAGHRANMLGKQEKGAGGRGGEAMEHLLAIAGSEMLDKAYEIELNAQDTGQLLEGYLQRYHDAYLIDEKGRKFLLSQFPRDSKVRVDGHSSSPVFMKNAFETGVILKRSNAITDEMLLKLSNIPQLSRALHDNRLIAFQKGLAEAQVRALQEQKRSGQHSGK